MKNFTAVKFIKLRYVCKTCKSYKQILIVYLLNTKSYIYNNKNNNLLLLFNNCLLIIKLV